MARSYSRTPGQDLLGAGLMIAAGISAWFHAVPATSVVEGTARLFTQ